ncbi:MAG: efflux RND transporter periplasmic adaptor subunit, partial [Candidatus Omnitrophota bacterium]
MSKRKLKLFLIIGLVLILGIFLFMKFRMKAETEEVAQEISPAFGTIETFISATGTVYPKNRLEIKPPVSGRVESILV